MCLIVAAQQLLFLTYILEGKVNIIFANKLALLGGWTEYGYLSMHIYQLRSLCGEAKIWMGFCVLASCRLHCT